METFTTGNHIFAIVQTLRTEAVFAPVGPMSMYRGEVDRALASAISLPKWAAFDLNRYVWIERKFYRWYRGHAMDLTRAQHFAKLPYISAYKAISAWQKSWGFNSESRHQSPLLLLQDKWLKCSRNPSESNMDDSHKQKTQTPVDDLPKRSVLQTTISISERFY